MIAVALALIVSRVPLTLPGGLAFDLWGGASPTPTTIPATQYPGWKLAWRDEFSGAKLDTTKWTVVSDAPGGFHHCCLGNTLNAWMPDDVSLVGGSLRLTTERRAFQSDAYTSGAVTTQGKFDFLYGRAVLRGGVESGWYCVRS